MFTLAMLDHRIVSFYVRFKPALFVDWISDINSKFSHIMEIPKHRYFDNVLLSWLLFENENLNPYLKYTQI